MAILTEEQRRNAAQAAQEPQGAAEAQPTAAEPAGTAGSAGGGYQSLLAEGAPSYNPSYDEEISGIIDDINNREGFHFNLNESDIYNQYRDRAVQNGQMAMQDTMGRAAGLTGGYGSSYAQTAGQQAYNRYLESLNDIVPELEANAYARWKDEGDEMKDRLDLLQGERAREYEAYLDDVNRYLTERQLLAKEDETAYERSRDEIADQRYEDELAWSRGQTSYSQLVSLIAASGYMPTEEELSAAGMTQAQAEALRNEYLRSTGQLDTGTSGGGYYYPTSDETPNDDALLEEAIKILSGGERPVSDKPTNSTQGTGQNNGQQRGGGHGGGGGGGYMDALQEELHLDRYGVR